MNYLAALGESAADAGQSGDGVSMTEQAERTYKISEFAAMTGMSPSKVRFYEKAGLFCANEREENGYRVFTPQDAFRANAFRVLLQYGFTVEHAIEMLDAKQDSAGFEGSLRSQRETLQRQIDLLNYRLRRIDGALEALEKSRAVQQGSPDDLATGGDFELADIDDIAKAYHQFSPDASWNGSNYTNATTGVKADNTFLVYQDTYIMGDPGWFMHATEVEVPEKYFTVK